MMPESACCACRPESISFLDPLCPGNGVLGPSGDQTWVCSFLAYGFKSASICLEAQGRDTASLSPAAAGACQGEAPSPSLPSSAPVTARP